MKINPHTKQALTSSCGIPSTNTCYCVGVKPRLVIGLGNPGKQYKNTYHNVGNLFIEYLTKKSYSALNLMKSDVFMNQSGLLVAKALKKSGAKPDQILIIHDDSDIELGKYKVSFARGSAGHRGIDSIIKSLGTKNFWRLRIGIGKKMRVENRELREKIKAADLVLKKISKKDREILQKIFSTIQLT